MIAGLALSCWVGCGSSLSSAPGSGGDPAGESPGLPGPASPTDEPVPADARYVAPAGDDSGPGSLQQPWRTVARAVTGLQPGDTVVLREGTYFEHDVRIAISGTDTQPITIRNHPGEQPILDAGLLPFRRAGNQDWVVFDAARNIYRSTATFPNAGQVFGHFSDRDGGYRLVPYERYGPFAADSEDYSETSDFYVGPGVFWQSSDQRIYVRLEPGRYQARTGCHSAADLDPRRSALFLFPKRAILDLQAPSSHLVFRGIALLRGESPVDIPSGCHHLTFRACDLLGGRYTVIVRGGAHDLLFDAISVHGRFPPWVARSDVKRPDSGPPAHSMQDAAIALEGAVAAIEIANSRFSGLFDAIDSNGAPTGLHIHHNEFTTIRDDVLEVATAGHDVDFHHNIVRRAAAAVSRNGSQAPPGAFAGTKYVHHNVIDTSTLQLYGRDDPQGLLPAKWRGPAGDGMTTGLAFGSHDTSALNGPDPFRIYHNTIVGAADVDGEGFGITYRFPLSSSAVPQAVFNNVFVQVGDQWIGRGARVDDGSQVFDGNVYHRALARPATALLEDYGNGTSTARFVSLVQFTTSAFWLQTRVHYAPGWESSGVEGDPDLDTHYRPSRSGPAATAGVDLSELPWPLVDRLSYRGAMPPRAGGRR